VFEFTPKNVILFFFVVFFLLNVIDDVMDEIEWGWAGDDGDWERGWRAQSAASAFSSGHCPRNEIARKAKQ
jgi:hypothetical protein